MIYCLTQRHNFGQPSFRRFLWSECWIAAVRLALILTRRSLGLVPQGLTWLAISGADG
jgi:hypothetical protein